MLELTPFAPFACAVRVRGLLYKNGCGRDTFVFFSSGSPASLSRVVLFSLASSSVVPPNPSPKIKKQDFIEFKRD